MAPSKNARKVDSILGQSGLMISETFPVVHKVESNLYCNRSPSNHGQFITVRSGKEEVEVGHRRSVLRPV